MSEKPRGKWFQFHLSSLMACVAALSALMSVNLPTEIHYQETEFSSGSTYSTPTRENYNCGWVKYGWPCNFYSYWRSYDGKDRNWKSDFDGLSLSFDLAFVLVACAFVVVLTEQILHPKLKTLLPIPGLEPIEPRPSAFSQSCKGIDRAERD
jgi:hypothetical protein